MSFKLFIHQNVVDTIEQLCVATRDTLPEDVIIESKQFMLIARDIVRQSDAYRSKIMYIYGLQRLIYF